MRAPFAEGVLLETLVLSILNHDTAIASAAARMVSAANGRPIIEMGSRRTHEQRRGRVGAGRLPGRFRVHVEPGGRPPLRHPDHRHVGARVHAAARLARSRRSAARSTCSAPDTTLLVDTYDITDGHRDRDQGGRARTCGAIRIDSGDLGVLARQARDQLDSLGARNTRIVVSGDLDEFAIAALRARTR